MNGKELEILKNNWKNIIKYHSTPWLNESCKTCLQTAEMTLKALENPVADDWETAYKTGYEYGYQQAIKDMAKKLKGMKWYGGDKQKERAAGMPEHHASGTGRVQQELQRAGAEEGYGGSMGTGAEED